MQFRFNEEERTYDLLKWNGEIETTIDEEEFDEDYFVCEDCGQAYARDWNQCVEDPCADHEYVRYCDGCHCYYEERNVEYCDATDDYRCDDCWESHSDEIGEYHDFKWQCQQGNVTFHKMPDEIEKEFDHPYIGFELETDGDGSADADDPLYYNRNTLDGFFHPEEDGSLSSRGIEWISEPATLPYHLNQMDLYKEFFKMLVRNGYTGHNNGNCGLHMHIDRKYFGDEQHQETAAAKLIFIFERHWENLLRFSRRTDSQCSSWCKNTRGLRSYGYYDKHRNFVEGTKANRLKSLICNTERYRAVNLCNDNTIEIRLWRGSLNPETVEATLKFTDRLAFLAKNTPAVKLYSMRWTDILGDDPVILSYWERVKNRNT